MDDNIFAIVPTVEQIKQLNGPKTIQSLKTADFLARQDYINEWIMDWTQRNDIDKGILPLLR